MPPIPPITQALLLINVGIFCVGFLLGPWFRALFALHPFSHGFMPWQLVSYGFLHGDVLHLFFNMLALWMFGSELEQLWGPKRYLSFLMVGVVSGGIAFLIITLIAGWPGALVGFSGAIFALLLGQALLFPNRTIMPLFPPIPMKMKYFAMIFGTIELFIAFSAGSGGLGSVAHLGGALGGFLMLRYWRGQPPFGKRRR